MEAYYVKQVTQLQRQILKISVFTCHKHNLNTKKVTIYRPIKTAGAKISASEKRAAFKSLDLTRIKKEQIGAKRHI